MKDPHDAEVASESRDNTGSPFRPPKDASTSEIQRPGLWAVAEMLIVAVVASCCAFAGTCLGSMFIAPLFFEFRLWGNLEFGIVVGGVAAGLYIFSVALFRNKRYTGDSRHRHGAFVPPGLRTRVDGVHNSGTGIGQSG